MPNNRCSVYLVAGNRLLREALASLLNERGDFDVCGVSPCVPDTISSVVASGAKVLILDSVTARLSDCALISKIVGQVPGMKVVLIDMDDDREIFLECVRAGAIGYLLRDVGSYLNLSEQTVKNHIHGIMRRVGAEDRLQVIDLTHFSGEVQ